MTRFRIRLIVQAILVASALGTAAIPAAGQHLRPGVSEALADLESTVGRPAQLAVSPETGLVTFISFAPDRQPPSPLRPVATVAEQARSFLETYGKAFGLSSDASSLVVTRQSLGDRTGMDHVRYRQHTIAAFRSRVERSRSICVTEP